MRAVRAYKDEHLHRLQTVTDYRLIEESAFTKSAVGRSR